MRRVGCQSGRRPGSRPGTLRRMGVGDERRGAAWRFVRAAARSQSGGVAGAVSSGLLWQLGAVAAPLIVGTAIDHGIVTGDRHTLLLWLIALLCLGLLEVSAGGMRHIYAIRNRSRSDAQVRDAIFAHALRLDASYHDRVGPGELLSRASSDSLHVARMMDAIGHTIGYALTVVAVAIVMLILDVQLALIVLIPLPFVSLGAWLYSRRYDAGTRKLQESWGEASTLVEETVSGIRVVKGLGAGDALSARFRRRSDEVYDRAMVLARLDAAFNPVLEMLPLLGIAVVLWIGGRQVIDGTLQLGSFVAFNAYVVMLVWPLRVLGQRVTTLQKALAASGRITEVLEAEPRLRDPRHPRDARAAGARRRAARGRPLRPRGRPRGARRARPARRSGRVARAGRRDRLRQEHRRRPARAALRPGGRARPARRPRPPRFADRGRAQRGRARVRGDVSVQRERAREHPRSGGRTRTTPRSSARRRSQAPRSSSPTFRPATTPSSASAGSRSRAASASGSRSRGRSWPTPRCSSWTTPRRRSTRPRSTRSARRSER